MKKRILLKVYQLICILLFFLLLSHAGLVLIYAKKGLYSWAYSVVPVLLPFIILSKFWIHWKIPQTIFRTASRIFPRHNALATNLAIMGIGLCAGFPVGAVFLRNFYEETLLSKREAELLLPLCSFVSPMFLFGYVRPLLGYGSQLWSWFLLCLYTPLFLTFFLCRFFQYFSVKKPMTARHTDSHPVESAPKKRTAASTTVKEIWLSSLEIIFTIGIYMMLFSVLSGLALQEPCLNHPVTELLLCNLEITTGMERLSRINSLPSSVMNASAAFTTALGGLCTAAQIHSVVGDSGLSVKRYFVIKSICSVLSALMFTAVPS